MKKLIKGKFSGTVLLGVLFFAAGCGSREEDSPPNYVVNRVQTGTTAGDTKAAGDLADKEADRVPTGGLSIIQEDIAGANGKDTEGRAEGGDAYGEDNNQEREEQEDQVGQENQGNQEVAPDFKVPVKNGAGNDSAKDGAEGELYVSTIQEDSDVENVEDVDEGEFDADKIEVVPADELALLPAGTKVDIAPFTVKQVEECFNFGEITDSVFLRMKGNSYAEGATIDRGELSYVRVLHYNLNGEVCIGEMVVNSTIAQEIRDIFLELFELQYPIGKMVLIDTYGGDDKASMADNNTSAFNFRYVEGTTSLSWHAYGLAVDINPLYNPYIPEREGVEKVLPENALPYVDRDAECEYYIQHGDPCYEAFVSRGFEWGGDWEGSKDYQHFFKAQEQD